MTNKESLTFLKIVDPNFKMQVEHFTISNRVVNGTPLDPVFLTVTQKPVLKNGSKTL